MKLTLAEPKYLKDSIIIISEVVNEARFRIKKDSIELVAMDPANVAMVIFKLLSSSFTEYSLEKDMDISINLNNLKQVLRRAGPNDMISLEVDAKNKLKVILLGHSKRMFSIPLIDIEEKEQKIPDLKFPATIKMPSGMLDGAIADVDIVGESVSFVAEEGMLMLKAEGDLSSAQVEIKAEGDTEIKVEGGVKLKSKYSVEYLKKMIAGSKVADQVVVSFNSDYPLKIDYIALDKMSMSFILAPRVDNE